MTGRLFESAAGVHTFTARQSSDCTELLFSVGSIVTIWGQAGAKSSANRVPRHGLCSTGGRNLNAPTGGSAKGIPRNTCTPRSQSPCTSPAVVITVRPPVPAEVTAMLAAEPASAAATKRTKRRTFIHSPSLSRLHGTRAMLERGSRRHHEWRPLPGNTLEDIHRLLEPQLTIVHRNRVRPARLVPRPQRHTGVRSVFSQDVVRHIDESQTLPITFVGAH